MRKETPTLDAGQHNLSYLDAGADAHPLEEQLAMLRQMTKELEHEIDDILAEASEVVGVAPDMNRSKVIRGLVPTTGRSFSACNPTWRGWRNA